MLKIHHICIQTDVYEESLAFYTGVLNFRKVMETENFHSRKYNTWLESEGFMIELQTLKKGEVPAAVSSDSLGLVHFCLYTDNITREFNRMKEDSLCRFKKKDGKVIYNVEKGSLFKVIAPEGSVIEIRDSLQP